ncbi:hypothetical protein PJI21_29135, partial [Mycobacterium kansasii]
EPEVSVETETAALDAEKREPDFPTVSEEVSQIINNKIETEEVSIGTEIADLNSTNETRDHDIVCLHEDPSTSSTNFHENLEHGSERKY